MPFRDRLRVLCVFPFLVLFLLVFRSLGASLPPFPNPANPRRGPPWHSQEVSFPAYRFLSVLTNIFFPHYITLFCPAPSPESLPPSPPWNTLPTWRFSHPENQLFSSFFLELMLLFCPSPPLRVFFLSSNKFPGCAPRYSLFVGDPPLQIAVRSHNLAPSQPSLPPFRQSSFFFLLNFSFRPILFPDFEFPPFRQPTKTTLLCPFLLSPLLPPCIKTRRLDLRGDFFVFGEEG